MFLEKSRMFLTNLLQLKAIGEEVSPDQVKQFIGAIHRALG